MDSIYFHEDDFLQAEIVPRENAMKLKQDNEELKELQKKNPNDLRVDDVKVIEEHPVSTIDRKIKLEEIEEIALHAGFKRIDEIFTGYSSLKEKSENTTAFELDDNIVFCHYNEEKILRYLWVDGFKWNEDSEYKLEMQDLLYAIGTRWDMVLNDWVLAEMIDLKDRQKILDYIEEE